MNDDFGKKVRGPLRPSDTAVIPGHVGDPGWPRAAQLKSDDEQRRRGGLFLRPSWVGPASWKISAKVGVGKRHQRHRPLSPNTNPRRE